MKKNKYNKFHKFRGLALNKNFKKFFIFNKNNYFYYFQSWKVEILFLLKFWKKKNINLIFWLKNQKNSKYKWKNKKRIKKFFKLFFLFFCDKFKLIDLLMLIHLKKNEINFFEKKDLFFNLFFQIYLFYFFLWQELEKLFLSFFFILILEKHWYFINIKQHIYISLSYICFIEQVLKKIIDNLQMSFEENQNFFFFLETNDFFFNKFLNLEELVFKELINKDNDFYNSNTFYFYKNKIIKKFLFFLFNFYEKIYNDMWIIIEFQIKIILKSLWRI